MNFSDILFSMQQDNLRDIEKENLKPKRKLLPVEIWLVYVPYTDKRAFPWEIRLIKWKDNNRYVQEFPYIFMKQKYYWKQQFTSSRGRQRQTMFWQATGRRFYIGEL